MKSKSKVVTQKRITSKWLRKIGVKEVLIPGIILAAGLGWVGWKNLGPNYYNNKQLFPESGIVREVIDGDTFRLQNGRSVRMVGINAPDRGEKDYEKARDYTVQLVQDKRVWLEYDRYQDDNSGGRILAWIWTECGSDPKFTPPDYMHLTYNRSKEGLVDNPEGCKQGKLIQEELVKVDMAEVEVYKDRGELKYESRIKIW